MYKAITVEWTWAKLFVLFFSSAVTGKCWLGEIALFGPRVCLR